MTDESRRIIIFYSERSGSNLLRVLLGNHSQISAPVPPHLLDAFKKEVHLFGDLSRERNMVKFLDGLIQYVNHSFSDWNLEIGAVELFDSMQPQTFIEAFDAIYKAKTRRDGKKHYVCKDNHMFDYAFPLLHRLNNLKFIYLYRDPRDVVSSWMKHRMLYFTPFDAAQAWKAEQKKCIELEQVYSIDMHHVSYEDLVRSTEQAMTGVLEYLGLEVEEACFSNEGNKPEAERNILWKNLNKPIMRDNTRNFETVLSGKKINMVESITSEQMRYLGYEPITDGTWKVRSNTLFRIINTVKKRLWKKFSGKKDEKTSKLIRDRINLRKKIIEEASR